MEEIKFTDEELTKLKELQDKFNNSILQFGQLQIEEINLKETKNKLIENYNNLINEEKTLSKQLSDKYGDGILDPKTGIFTPSTQLSATN